MHFITSRLLLTGIVCLLCLPCSFAQVCTKLISSFDSLSQLSYSMTVKEKDPFSDNLFTDTLQTYLELSQGHSRFQVEGRKNAEVYDGNKLIQMDLNKNSYRIQKGMDASVFQYKALPYLIGAIQKDLQKNATVISHHDSIIMGKAFYHVEIVGLDSMQKNQRVYRLVHVYIDKESYLPICYKSEQQGFIDGTDMFVHTYTEMQFTDYAVNRKKTDDLAAFVVPAHFSIETPKEKKPLLAKGTPAPALQLNTQEGAAFSLKSLQGKVVLLNFSSISCPHSAESVGMLNSLYASFAKEAFAIVTIHPFDQEETVLKYNQKRAIQYPAYRPIGSQNTDHYHVDSYPTFYLIDKQGYILQGFSGYDASIREAIQALLQQAL